MIPISVEPTCLSFDLAYPGHLAAKDFPKEFVKFTGQVHELFSKLQNLGIGILATSELYAQFSQYIPTQAYKDAQISKIAIETFSKKLYQMIKIHPLINSDPAIDFEPSSLSANPMSSNQFYVLWRNMMRVHRDPRLPAWILKSTSNSIFVNQNATLTDFIAWTKTLHVTDDPLVILQSHQYSLWKLGQIKAKSRLADVPCKGTGSHSSMWGNKIKTIQDIPAFERDLLTSLVDTGLVLSITLLSFDKRYSVVSQPLLHIARVEQGQSCDALICILHGKGSKQNGQTVRIEVIRGTGSMFESAFESEITPEKLEYFLSIRQVASQ